jgi:hypothetical protein
MAELTINQIIKIMLGVLIFVIIVMGAYFAFKDYIIPYFKIKFVSVILSLLW